MGIIVGSTYSYLQCDKPFCKNCSPHVSGENSGQHDVVKQSQLHGWQYCHTTGKSFCPDHAFGKETEADKERDRWLVTIESQEKTIKDLRFLLKLALNHSEEVRHHAKTLGIDLN